MVCSPNDRVGSKAYKKARSIKQKFKDLWNIEITLPKAYDLMAEVGSVELKDLGKVLKYL